MLRDPKQKRFFKSKDIHDLFTLGDQYAGASETAHIFSSLHGSLEVPLDPDSVAIPVETTGPAGAPPRPFTPAAKVPIYLFHIAWPHWVHLAQW